MRPEGNPDDTYSRATLCACSSVPLALFALNSLKFHRRIHAIGSSFDAHAMFLLASVLTHSSRPFSGDFVLTLNLIYSLCSSVTIFHLFYVLYRNEYSELPAVTFRGCGE